eukprot:scaffold257518_cov103-Cyclotella_meneghiniana.AAC.1
MMSKKFFPRSNSSTASSKASTSSSFFRRRKRTTSKSNTNNSDVNHDSNNSNNMIAEPPPLNRRSISPSDLHYFTTASGGCNAPLVPLEYHYESNQTLLDLFHATLLMNRENTSEGSVNGGSIDVNDYGVAYGIGKKYIETALFTIPNHSYYYGKDCEEERRRSVMEARRVIALLENMLMNDNNNDGSNDTNNDDEDDEQSAALNEKRETIHQLSIVARRSYEQIMMGDNSTSTTAAAAMEEWTENVESTCTSWREYVLDSSTHLCSLLEALDCRGGGLKSVVVVEEKIEQEDGGGQGIGGAGTAAVDDCLTMKKETETAGENDKMTIAHSQDNVSLQKALSTTSDTSKKNAECRSQIDIQPSMVSSEPSRDAPSSKDNQDDENNNTLQNSFSMQPQISELDVIQGSESVKTTSPERGDTINNESTTLIDQQPTGDLITRNSLTSDGFNRDELALVLSLSKHDCAMVQHEKNSNNRPLRMSEQTSYYQQYFHSLVDKNVFDIRFLDTYQGRIRGSNNGCTVIAPLTCIQYLTATNQDNVSLYGLNDAHINEVIDVHAPSILSNVRTKLHLPPDSFIIPSDVHDHLLEVGLLSPSSFVGVCGGNILDDEHLMQLQQSLLMTHDENEYNTTHNGHKRKVASPMFFHGHVVALHVIREEEKVWIELIDSLPNPEAWMNTNNDVVSRQAHPSTLDLNDAPSFDERREPHDEWERHDQLLNDTEDELPLNAVRVRCTEVTHFGTLLKHYALSAFSYEEKKFIDENQWEDNN